ncbi:DUF2190 family protein [Paucibacter sp. TC2R-5]|uniref:capsid cement protein n=1 Tax=Paucibacter sp. TC2R-5 TaxID=2893555 RepID=UPI0021E4E883|nr:capsid cement protein [Paucibacter sp. TC2R-5]MCV2359637.1 DUF2190 family protein [Paucibacter sp. TC2R-5]
MSQQGIPLLCLSIVAVGAIAVYRGVGFNQAQATVAGQKVMGISRRPGASGTELEVVTKGTAVCEAGAAIAVGAALAMDAAGRVITASALTGAVGTLAVAAGGTAVTSAVANGAGSVSGAPTFTGGDLPQYIVGYALQAAGAAGEFIEILMN